ncbi:MAG: triose-phosphate isomerase [Bacteroidaceae bacterium]|nr:triose-phosphate isomerase [Bacteroidaceae bacterium]
MATGQQTATLTAQQAARVALVNLCRAALSATFILSGFVKAIDPKGTQYKIEDYLQAAITGATAPEWLTLGTSVTLSAMEFTLGVALLFAVMRKATTCLATAMLVVMTAITTWLYIANPISDCGCFGDALHLTNGQTLAKNILLLAMAAVTAWRPKDMIRLMSKNNGILAINYSALFIIVCSLYSLHFLPPFDFRPYHIGANIIDDMAIPDGAPQPVFETTFIMTKDGQTREFTLEDYPDSTWTYVDTKTVMKDKGYVPPIHDFDIEDASGNNITEEVLTRPGYTFLLIAPHLENASDSNFGPIDQIYEYAQEHGYPFYCLTASVGEAIARWQDMTGAEYPFCTTDPVTLKTIVRSNPGLLLLKDATIIQKWSHNELPSEDELSAPLEQLPIGQQRPTSDTKTILKTLAWFILPLMLLSIADRTFELTQRFRRKRRLAKQNSKKIASILTHKKEKKMAKKIVAGNWKMNKNLQEGIALAKELTEVVKNPNCEVVIGTPFIHLASVAEVIKGSCIKLSAENCANKAAGAYTGEVSAEMVKSTGAEYVILGHSERREYYNETPAILKEKVELALANGLKVIFCIGESLEERDANKQEEVCKMELTESVFHLTPEQWKNIVIAYEPIWAIGTGKTATADQAEEIHAYIRACVAEVYGADAAAETTILYGGSCKASNAPELFAKPDIDGGLIGGASLKAADFQGIIDAWK